MLFRSRKFVVEGPAIGVSFPGFLLDILFAPIPPSTHEENLRRHPPKQNAFSCAVLAMRSLELLNVLLQLPCLRLLSKIVRFLPMHFFM